jgi:hypothetical protein
MHDLVDLDDCHGNYLSLPWESCRSALMSESDRIAVRYFADGWLPGYPAESLPHDLIK